MFDKFYTSQFKDITKKICKGDESWQDIHQDAIVLIYEKYPNFTTENLEGFFATITWQLYQNHRRNLDNQAISLNESIDSKEELYSDLPDIIVRYLDVDDGDIETRYNKNLVKLYLKYGTFKRVSEETQIPFCTLYRDYKRYIKQLHDKFKDSITSG